MSTRRRRRRETPTARAWAPRRPEDLGIADVSVFFRGHNRDFLVAEEKVERKLDRDLPRAADKSSASLDDFGKRVDVLSVVRFPALLAGAGFAAQGLGAVAAAAAGVTAAIAPASGVVAAMPGLFAAAAQGAGTLSLAFRGMGDAVKAENMKEFREATKGWTDEAKAAATFARGPLKDAFEGLQQTAQRNFFTGDLMGAARRALGAQGGNLRQIVGQTSGAVSGVATRGLNMLSTPAWQRDIATIGGRNVKVIETLGSAALHAGNALRHIMVAVGPLVQWLAGLAERFGKFVEAQAQAGRESGRLGDFFEKTKDTLSLLGRLLGNVGRTLWEVGKAAAPLGRSILVALNREAKKMADWAQSEGGRQTLRQYFKNAKPIVFEVGRLIRDVFGAFFRLSGMSPKRTGLLSFLENLRTKVLPAIEKVISGTVLQLGPKLGPTLGQFADLFKELGGSSGPLTVMVQTLGDFAGGLAEFLREHPAFRDFVVTFAGFVGVFKALNIVKAVTGLSTMLGLFTPSKVATTSGMGTALSGTAAGANATAVAAPRAAFGIRAIGAALRANPIGFIVTVLQLLAAGLILAWQRSETFRRIVTTVWNKVKGVVSSVVGWLRDKVPAAWEWIKDKTAAFRDRVLDIWNGLRDGIKRIWTGVKDFVSDGWSAIVSTARSWVNRLIGGINWVLDKIGVDRRVPYWLGIAPGRGNANPRNPNPGDRATGGWMAARPGGVYRVAEAGHDEMVLTTDPRHRKRQFDLLGEWLRTIGVRVPDRAAGGWAPRLGSVSGDTDYVPALHRALQLMAGYVGRSIYVQSGRRTIAEQWALYQRYLAGGNLAAYPNPNAPHVRGIAADITPGREVFGSAAGRFGLGFTVPSESWHVELARAGASLIGLAGRLFSSIREALSWVRGLIADRIPGIPRLGGSVGAIVGGSAGFLRGEAVEWLMGRARDAIGMANGGVIREPVFGLGLRSGRGYAFGERGAEYVSPAAPLVVNISIRNPQFYGRDRAAVRELAYDIRDELIPLIARNGSVGLA